MCFHLDATGYDWPLNSSGTVKSIVLSEDEMGHLGLEETRGQRQRALSSDSVGTPAISCLGLGLTIPADLHNSSLDP